MYMDNVKIRAVVLDVDGTLTDENKVISLEILSVLRKLDKNGIKIIFATGNVMPVIYGIYMYLGLRWGSIIAENGGVIFHNSEIEVLGDRKEIDKILNEKADKNRYRLLFTDRWRVSEVALTMDSDLGYIESLFHNDKFIVEVSGFAIHIAHSGISKRNGVKEMLKRIGIDRSEVSAFGDGDNDADLLSYVGTGIAVANGSAKAKSNAKYVTVKPHSEGVIEGLRYLNIL